MYKIVRKRQLSDDVCLFGIEAPEIAKKRLPGQFVIIRVTATGERIPLTIADSDTEEGTITLIVQGIGKTTKMLNNKKEGESIQDVVGPLGKSTDCSKKGSVVIVGGGVGIAIAYPIAKAMKENGNEVISILGARDKPNLILEDEVKEFADEVHVTTDDGSYGRKGFVTDALKDIIESGKEIKEVVAIGPVVMMRAVAEVTRPHNIHTIVSLNPVMIDGTGMCGGCRVTVGGKTKYACVDGPEFDGHEVDFAELMNRLSSFAMYEKESLEEYEHKCKLEGV